MGIINHRGERYGVRQRMEASGMGTTQRQACERLIKDRDERGQRRIGASGMVTTQRQACERFIYRAELNEGRRQIEASRMGTTQHAKFN